MKLTYPPGATPLDHEHQEQLLIDATTQDDLNRAEASNVVQAVRWARGNARLCRELLSATGLLRLHEKMFGETWRWAGKNRTHNTSIGVDYPEINEQIAQLCGNVAYWIEHEIFPWPELAIRFHHALVSIHPFVNGNGRHARLAADVLLECHDHQPLPWGGGDSALGSAGEAREEYLAGLREADEADFSRLVRFGEQERTSP